MYINKYYAPLGAVCFKLIVREETLVTTNLTLDMFKYEGRYTDFWIIKFKTNSIPERLRLLSVLRLKESITQTESRCFTFYMGDNMLIKYHNNGRN